MTEAERMALVQFIRDTRDAVVQIVESRYNAVLSRLGDEPYVLEAKPYVLEELCINDDEPSMRGPVS